MIKVATFLIAMFFHPANAFAVHYGIAAKPTMIAGFLIVPLALLLFVLSGAYFYDKRNRLNEGRSQMGLAGPLILILLSFLGGAFMGIVIFLLALYAVGLGIKMLRVGKDPLRPRIQQASRMAGGFTIAITVFLLSFTVVFDYDHYWWMSARHILREGAEQFSKHQAAYAANHDGVYQNIVPIRRDEINQIEDTEMKEGAGDSMAWQFSDDFCRPTVLRCTITYGPEFKTFEVRLTPVKFLPWPYRYFDSPRAFYMDQTGVVRYEEINEPGRNATVESKFYKRML